MHRNPFEYSSVMREKIINILICFQVVIKSSTKAIKVSYPCPQEEGQFMHDRDGYVTTWRILLMAMTQHTVFILLKKNMFPIFIFLNDCAGIIIHR